MIYLDAAATTLQKPPAVSEAVLRAMQTMASPGRGAHEPAMLAAQTAFDCRCAAADLFHVEQPEQVVFTFNATHGLNLAIHSLLEPGDPVVISGYEHNAVTRPLRQLGARIRVAGSRLFDANTLAGEFAAKLPGAKAAVCTMTSNVFGYRIPMDEIAELCRKNGVPLIVDAAQSAGCQTIDFTALGAAFVAMPGHKGLMGPQGTGLLLCARPGEPLIAGGTGTDSRNLQMPGFLPDRLEAGTHNIPGIAGLLEGMRYIHEQGAEELGRWETHLLGQFADQIQTIPDLEVFRAADPQVQSGVLSLRHPAIDCETLAEALGRVGVAVRAGLHCAPLAHDSAGTGQSGTVRFSFSPWNTEQETEQAARILAACVKNLVHK